jgi:dinuclear metal center YbgI/SA1388 family protein
VAVGSDSSSSRNKMKLSEIIAVFESYAPLSYQESYDNAGLTVGDPGMEITAALLCVDVTEAVVEEARQQGANLIISHHPVIFKPLKQITGGTGPERTVISAISNKIALYCAHTNMDNVSGGVNRKICQKLDLEKTRILSPLPNSLRKLVTFVPTASAEEVRTALFAAGAGNIGAYDACSFNLEGKGSFRASEGSNPYTGEIGKLHFENETRIETIFPAVWKTRIIKALLKVHPYEEVAYDIFPVENEYEQAGWGMIGELKESADTQDFLRQIKDIFKCQVIRHTRLISKTVKRIAVCGGSGSFLIHRAISSGADMFITGDVKYHQFFDAEDRIVIVDIGHFESEQFTIEIFYEILKKNLPNFAIHFSSIQTNPIYYI